MHRTFSIVKRPRKAQGFRVLQWRWIVERTFGWLNRSRRLSKDFEALPETTENVDPNRHDPINEQTACSQNVTFQTGSQLLRVSARSGRKLLEGDSCSSFSLPTKRCGHRGGFGTHGSPSREGNKSAVRKHSALRKCGVCFL